jgi:hypothetical protein
MAALGMSQRGVEKLARLPVDPLPLRLLGRSVWILSQYLEQWAERRADLRRVRRGARPSLPVLVGRKAVAARAGVTVKQVERWSKLPFDPLPVRGRDRRERLPGGMVWVYDAALRDVGTAMIGAIVKLSSHALSLGRVTCVSR